MSSPPIKTEAIKSSAAELAGMVGLEDDRTKNIYEALKESNPSPDKINFLDGEDFKNCNWEDMKMFMRNYWKHYEKLVLMAHKNDTLIGKVQLVQGVKAKMSVLQLTEKKVEDENKKKIKVKKIKFIDDRYDRRYDGYEVDSVALDFWIYKLVEDGIEYYLFSIKELGTDSYLIRGTKIEMNVFSEISKSLKFRGLSNIFLVGAVEPSIKKMDREELVSCCKKDKWDKTKFSNFIFTHPDGKIYNQLPLTASFMMSQLLSGKFEGYPLHGFYWGKVGTGKTYLLESLDAKFMEEMGILEAGNSTPKFLIPSFKEKPANAGYLIKCVRVALVDELMKMIENEASSHNPALQNYFGQLNMILEHKKRTVGSGNDNNFFGQATAKLINCTNPISNKKNLQEHVGTLDDTFMSRVIHWVHDEEHEGMIAKRNIKENKHTYARLYMGLDKIGNSISEVCLLDRDHNNVFLSLYDSCQTFLSTMDESRIKKIFTSTLTQAQEPMKSVWKARGFHHSLLILDGLTKYRCLFQDYDSSFKSKDEDYDLLEKIIIRMMKGWNYNISAKTSENWKGSFN